MHGQLSGQVVCVTGAAGGIGSAIARLFAEAGADLALLDSNEQGLARLKEEIRFIRGTTTRVHTVVADLSTEPGVKMGIEQVLEPFHQIDTLVANVGTLISGRFEELSARHWIDSFAINFFSHIFACQAILPLMKQQKRGHIVFIGSDQALQPDSGLSPYGRRRRHFITWLKRSRGNYPSMASR